MDLRICYIDGFGFLRVRAQTTSDVQAPPQLPTPSPNELSMPTRAKNAILNALAPVFMPNATAARSEPPASSSASSASTSSSASSASSACASSASTASSSGGISSSHVTPSQRRHLPLNITAVLDNSGSMGGLTRVALSSIAAGLADMPNVVKTNVVVFADHAVTHGPFHSGRAVRELRLPVQGGTNITEAIETALSLIDSQTDVCHHILTFLSDGQHTFSVPLMEPVPRLTDKKLTVVVVGIGSCDVRFGMKLKESETVPMDSLANIYFAPREDSFAETCADVVNALTKHTQSGLITKIRAPADYVFAHTQQRECTVFFAEEAKDQFFLLVPSNSRDQVCQEPFTQPFCLDDQLAIVPAPFEPNEREIASLVDTLTSQFARVRLALQPSSIRYNNMRSGATAPAQQQQAALDQFHARIHQVEVFLDACEAMHKLLALRRLAAEVVGNAQGESKQIAGGGPQDQEEEVALPSAEVVMLGLPGEEQKGASVQVKVGTSKKTAKRSTYESRLALVQKKIRGATCMFAQQRNQLQDLTCAIENDSAAQAAFLNGMDRKFAAKAVRRAGTLETTVDEVWEQLQRQLPEWDKGLLSSSQEGASDNADSSCLSCNTVREALAEWPQILRTCTASDFTNLFSLLVAFGLNGYPVKFLSSNAVQMDPFQTRCLFIETVMIDSAMLFLAKQTGRELLSPHSNKPFDSVLVLVDPSCPQAGLLAVKSKVYEFLLSATLARDLYMFNFAMTSSLHAHSFVAAMGQHKKHGTKAFLELALKILYSARKLRLLDGKRDMFKHWIEWGGLTQSQADDCPHPSMIPLMLATQQRSEEEPAADLTVPLLTLVNEVLARQMKGWLLSRVRGPDDSAKERAVEILMDVLDIDPADSPVPIEDVLILEPPVEETRAKCKPWTTVNQKKFEAIFGENTTVRSFVEKQIRDDFAGFQLAEILFALQPWRQREGVGGWEQEFEADQKIRSDVLDSLHKQLTETSYTRSLLQRLECKDNEESVYLAMLAQAMLCHESQTRVSIADQDVRRGETLQTIIVDLRMVHYLRKLKLKKQQYLAIIGDVTLSEALSADESYFDNMLGVHTHGLSKSQFWACHEAAKRDQQQGSSIKADLFLRKSNNTVTLAEKKKN